LQYKVCNGVAEKQHENIFKEQHLPPRSTHL
jgi:hypothetical protein